MLEILANEKIVVALIIGFATMFMKFVIRPLVDYAGKKLKIIMRIAAELVPNGGNSMWDKIDRIDRRTVSLHVGQVTSLHLIRMVSSHGSNIMWTCDAEGDANWFNQLWLDFTGLPASASHGYGWVNGLHPDDRSWVMEAWQSAVEHSRDFNETFRLQHDETNETVTVRAKASPIMSEDGKSVIAWTGQMSEIAPRTGE